MLTSARLRHPTGQSCQMVLLLLLLLLKLLLLLRLMVVLLVMLLVVMRLLLLLQLAVMLDLLMVLGRSRELVLLLLLLDGRRYGDAIVVLVVESLVVGEGPVAGQRVGAFETGGCVVGVVEVVLDLLGYGPVVPGRRLVLEMPLLLLRLPQV